MHDSNPTGAGQNQRRRPPGWSSPPALTERCSSCGAHGADRAAVADLEIVWLLPDPTGPTAAADEVIARRFCRSCRPDGDVAELACAGCGDGPLLAGALADADLAAAAAIDAWLTATGWRLALTRRAGPWCPACAAVVYPRTPTSPERASTEQASTEHAGTAQVNSASAGAGHRRTRR